MGNQELCDAALKAIAEARTKEWNVLTADVSLSGMSDWHVPVVEKVTLETKIVGIDGTPVGGDIYLQAKSETESKRRYAISRQGLSKLAVAAGVIWSASETRRTDNRASRDYVSFQAVGGIQKPDGTYTFMKAEYDLDMEVVEEEMINQKKKDWEIKKEMIQKRKNKLKLCESGAKDRVIRELLGIKATYPLDQINKPFIVLRITVRPDYSDKEVKRAMLAAAIQSMTGIYGGTAPAQIPYDEATIIDVSTETGPGNADNMPEGEKKQEDEGKPDPKESALLDFQNSEEFGQCKAITDCALRKGYDLAGWQKRACVEKLDALSKEHRLSLFTHIINLPDKSEPGNAPY